nr:MAG TPA: hypothetical protein [Bacteriophage sp.]
MDWIATQPLLLPVNKLSATLGLNLRNVLFRLSL